MITALGLQNFRCFKKATAQCKPLTILVGENSVGKTSFMAMARACLETAFSHAQPNSRYFNMTPFFLGGFDDMVYSPRGKPEAEWFEGTLSVDASRDRISTLDPTDSKEIIYYTVRFEKHGTNLIPVKRKFEHEGAWIEMNIATDRNGYRPEIKFGVNKKQWSFTKIMFAELAPCLFNFNLNFGQIFPNIGINGSFKSRTLTETKDLITQRHPLAHSDGQTIKNFLAKLSTINFDERILTTSPVRQEPSRTYDLNIVESETPGYLANLAVSKPSEWKKLKSNLEKFGKKSDLFSEITVEFIDSIGLFKLMFKTKNGRFESGWRNLTDIGYGVSQSLPLLVGLLRNDSPHIVFLQQPEVHLHPKAQASFGSLVCQLVAKGKIIFIETHSDNILDRIRMDVRDKVVNLHHNAVNTLFFEGAGQEVKIHTMGFNEQGNITGAPDSYREFFLNETNRDIFKRYRPKVK